MTQGEALALLVWLAAGLPTTAEGRCRLLERIAETDEPEALRAALVDLGAEALLRAQTRTKTHES